MDDFSTPGTVNGFGVPASPANYIEPGKRPYSSMAPTIVLNDNNDVQLVIGAAGGTAIPTSIVFVLLRHLFLDESIEQAMFARRLHHQLAPNVLDHEIGFDPAILQGLVERGHVLSSKDLLSVVTAIARNPDGSLTSVYDARRGGSAIAFRTQ
jgi:gamma-glutamyltranspeptidase / glutathione hydrolase / leukotriene-C4 hydrolase